MRVSVLSVLVTTWLPSAFGLTIDISPRSPRPGQNVLLNVSDIPQSFLLVEWYKGQSPSASDQIISIQVNGSPVSRNLLGFHEVDLFSNGSLQIRNLQNLHKGFYTVSVQMREGLLQAKADLILDDSTSGLSAGAIAGICVGVIAAVALIGVSVYVYIRKNSSGAGH
ncbi:cell adhesion molecule CEACAM19-like [Leptodactylus fuscus]|uniref:cell adhesion molecule CEACAM19-like n=1 Tax=Leptodactylus fuscus TaxID=238119 RepID=UPI003F4E81DF